MTDMPITYDDVGEPFDPTESGSVENAVYIGQQNGDDTYIIGNHGKEEWITTTDMVPLELERYR